jgi:hypothetical protein
VWCVPREHKSPSAVQRITATLHDIQTGDVHCKMLHRSGSVSTCSESCLEFPRNGTPDSRFQITLLIPFQFPQNPFTWNYLLFGITPLLFRITPFPFEEIPRFHLFNRRLIIRQKTTDARSAESLRDHTRVGPMYARPPGQQL